jgi:hypothetical protein
MNAPPKDLDLVDLFRGQSDTYHASPDIESMVRAVFLKKIKKWREMLARNLALRNSQLSQRELSYAVQATIDRIIFLRICEDRRIEPFGLLQKLRDDPDIYASLLCLYYKAEVRYKCGLFHFQAGKSRTEEPDTLTPSLVLDDAPLREILRELYNPEYPYQFSVLSGEILGLAYEQFLGKVIRLTAGHRAVVEDKPEGRKVGGVYYTPAHIVDYIVKQTVGKLLANRSPKQSARLRILDPACGSGSFLLGAYQLLLDWHRDSYLQDGPNKHTKELYQGAGGVWRLTTPEKKRILLANIYGVDIDSQAVEVTKLSLLLMMLEGELEQTRQSRLRHDRSLPDLSRNIRCGNSLIGPDFYDGQQMHLFEKEELDWINAFDWEKAFPRLRETGGFDVVIGNPPYIDSEWMTAYLPETRKYCVSRYKAASGNWDVFCVFVEKALQLAKPGGLVSMIVPNKLGSANYAAGCRKVLAANSRLTQIRDYSPIRVFPVSIYPLVFVALKNDQPDSSSCKVLFERMSRSGVGPIECDEVEELDYLRYFGQPERPWQIFGTTESISPAEKMRASCLSLESMASVLGAATVSEAYRIADLISELEPSDKENAGFKVVNSGTIDRYNILWGRKPMRYLGKTYDQPFVHDDSAVRLPPTRRHHAQSEKIIIAGMTLRLECALDVGGGFLAAKSTTLIWADQDLKCLLGILNSRAVAYWYGTEYGGNRLAGGYLRIGPPQVRKIPIPLVDNSKTADKQRQDRLAQLVDEMLSLQDELATANTQQGQKRLQSRIDATDCRIDHLVYELYGLTDAEIKIIEAAPM